MTTGMTRWAAMAAAATIGLTLTATRATAQQVYLSGGQLVAYGTAEDDYILAGEDLTHGTVTVTIYSLSTFQIVLQQTFPRSQVTRLYLNPLEGDDWAINSTSLASSMEGWSGDDHLVGGPQADDLWGDSAAYDWLAGDDIIEGDGGNDTINGGPGNDHLYGGCIGGSIASGDGDDAIFTGGGATEYADGGDGDNFLVSGEGVNFLYVPDAHGDTHYWSYTAIGSNCIKNFAFVY